MAFSVRNLPRVVTYELEPEGNHAAVEARVRAHIESLMDLNIPFHIESVHWKVFRHGGNVVKADCYGYRLTIGEVTEVDGHS